MNYPFNNQKIATFFNNEPTYFPGNPSRPASSVHVTSVNQFADWLSKRSPAAYAAIVSNAPQLLDGSYAVASGAMNAPYPATASGNSGLSGLGDFGDDTSGYSDLPMGTVDTSASGYGNTPTAQSDAYTSAISPATTVATGNTSSTTTATNWGADIISTIKTVLPSLFQAQSQQQLIAMNVKRAEQGLPPIDISSVTPGVNVGLSPSTTTLVYAGIAALAFVMLKKKR